jgi:hypothetical protein
MSPRAADAPVRIGYLPITDATPLWWLTAGYFEAEVSKLKSR